MLPVVDSSGLRCGWIPGRFGFPAHSLTLVAKGTFDLHPGAPATPAAEPLDLQGDEPWGEAPGASPRYDSDFAYFKPRADLLLVGACYPPAGGQTRCEVAFRVGDMQKLLQVVGERRWILPFGPFSPRSRPEPFERLELRYENAAGGGRSKRNPVGKGRRRARDGQGSLIRPVPSVATPGRALATPWLLGRPAGFAPLARTWRPRTRGLGTYRRRWRKTRWPWFPKNFDWAHFNAAPPDQRVPYLRGDEPIELRNLHPQHATYRSELPGLRTRCFLDRPETPEGGPRLVEVPLVLDTLWIDADAERLVLLWRGIAEVASPEFEEVAHAFFFQEPLDEPPADEARVGERFARARAAALGEEEEEPPADPEDTPEARRAFVEGIVKTERARFEDALEAAGLPRDFMRREHPGFEERGRQVLERLSAVPSSLGNLAEGVSLPAAMTPAQEAEILERFGLEIPRIEIPGRLSREDVERKVAAGESLAGEELGGLDLSGLALAGVDLGGAGLEGARLQGCDLHDAVLDAARLGGADLSGANLAGARLASADLSGARLAGADLSGAVLDEGGFERADLSGAVLVGVSAAAADFFGASLCDANLEGGVFESADFSETQLDGASLRGTNLRAATLEGARGERVHFDDADLTGLRAAACRLPRASFARARASDSTWEGAYLRGARFTEAILERADFGQADLVEADLSDCEMPEARFERAALQRARLPRANVFRGSFERADLSEIDLSGANLYEVETLDAVLDGARLRGANLRMTKLA